MNTKHAHKAETTTDRPFAGAVAPAENRAAHGNICRVEVCRCGATRRTNVNGVHREGGPWVRTSST